MPVEDSLLRIEQLLDRIASALERMASPANPLPQPGRTTVPQPVAEPSNSPINSSTSIAEGFLASRGICVVERKTPHPADEVLDLLARTIGENYNSLAELLQRIKQNMQAGQAFQFSINRVSQQGISLITNFCTALHRIGYFTKYRYQREPARIIHITVCHISQFGQTFQLALDQIPESRAFAAGA